MPSAIETATAIFAATGRIAASEPAVAVGLAAGGRVRVAAAAPVAAPTIA